MLFKDLNVLMSEQSIGRNPTAFLNIFVKAMSNNQNKSEFISKLYSNTLCQQSISYSLKTKNKVWGLFAKTFTNLHVKTKSS